MVPAAVLTRQVAARKFGHSESQTGRRDPPGEGAEGARESSPKLSGKRTASDYHPWRDLQGTEGAFPVAIPGDLSGTRTGGQCTGLRCPPILLRVLLGQQSSARED